MHRKERVGRLMSLASPAFLFGALLALWMLVGRTNAARFLGDEPHAFGELRLWICVAMALVASVMIAPKGGALRSARGRLLTGETALASLLLVFLMTSVAWSPVEAEALTKAYEVVLLLLVLLLVAIVRWSSGSVEIHRGFWFGVLAFGGLIAAVASVSGASFSGERLAVLGGGPNAFGRNMGLLSLAALALAHHRRRVMPWALLSVWAGVLVVLSGSRGALIALAGAAIVYALGARNDRRRLMVTLAAVAGAGWLLWHHTAIGALAADTYNTRVLTLLLEQGYTSGRGDLYRAAIELGSRNPTIGAGLGSFGDLRLLTYPHNLFLEVFAEGGMFALALLLGVLVSATGRFWRAAVTTQACTNGAAFCLLLLASQFSGDLYDSRGVLLLAVMGAESPFLWRRRVRRVAGPGRVRERYIEQRPLVVSRSA